jgi:hypothetical protein
VIGTQKRLNLHDARQHVLRVFDIPNELPKYYRAVNQLLLWSQCQLARSNPSIEGCRTTVACDLCNVFPLALAIDSTLDRVLVVFIGFLENRRSRLRSGHHLGLGQKRKDGLGPGAHNNRVVPVGSTVDHVSCHEST